MLKCFGKSVLKGIAVGKIYLYRKKEFVLTEDKVEDAEAEIRRFEEHGRHWIQLLMEQSFAVNLLEALQVCFLAYMPVPTVWKVAAIRILTGLNIWVWKNREALTENWKFGSKVGTFLL